MNRRFLGHDWPTDVITFDYPEGRNGGSEKKEGDGVSRRISGDIFIDPATVAANAEALCVAPEVEMRRVMVHGCLHLCGYGDKTPREQRRMRAREDFYLARYYLPQNPRYETV
jgi:rRNA maturation RNase YbeY